jgi:flagellar biogenesis protein FliO
LRVHETVSLGEKRFVALLSVEGREFLIGGGPTGVSLLAQLGTALEPAEELQRELGVTGDIE